MVTDRFATCPSCGADWIVIGGMLADPPESVTVRSMTNCGCITRQTKVLESENHALAKLIIGNCSVCKSHFEGTVY